jgi:hypothetical protein
MIVKVQRSVVTNDPTGPQVLVYNEDRSVEYQEPLTDAVADLMGERVKMYLYARVRDGVIILGYAAPEQDW